MNTKAFFLSVCLGLGTIQTQAQITERERPAEWAGLVNGARFMDRFMPMVGGNLSSDTWGANCVLPRYVDNGIEDRVWSYWGGNIMKCEDGKYHIFVCGWLESSKKGHMEWPNSYTFNAVGDTPHGPFKVRNMIGKGHNPEAFRTNDGRYVLYVIDGRYVADDVNGKWEYGKFDFDNRDRRIVEGLSNLSFAKREDGSFLMVCRGGGIWVSRDGLDTYKQISDGSVYPKVQGRFEDPVMWKDHVQYHLIVNDWYGRIAYYLRSKNGLDWVVDPGEAYMPGVAAHPDGQKEDWFKYERMKVFQDEYGRAVQANFAVIDTLKHEDKPYDTHSSKNITIPLNPGMLLTLVDTKPITSKTKAIKVMIQAERGFNPQTDIDIETLRFGASSEVNFGRGSKAISAEAQGKDLIVTFDGEGHGITAEEFAPKVIGKTKEGTLLYGYMRLPYIHYDEPILSALAPRMNSNGTASVKVSNFGLTKSAKGTLTVEWRDKDGRTVARTSAGLKPLLPYEEIDVTIGAKAVKAAERAVVTITQGKHTVSRFDTKVGH